MSGRAGAAAAVGVFLGAFAFLVAAMLVSIRELADPRIRTQADLERVTELPVWASLGELDRMSQEERDQWAFQTFTHLKRKLGRDESAALVCGFISARHGEGRSTWIDLLAGAAWRRGHRVAVISSPKWDAAESKNDFPSDLQSTLTSLDAPAEVTRKLVLAEAPPILQLTLPPSAWSIEWRGRWQHALQQWSGIENLVLLIAPTPLRFLISSRTPKTVIFVTHSITEAILLSEEIPQLIWLCAKDRATTTETRSQMETLRASNCGLVGSVFNRAEIPKWRKRFAHLVAILLTIFCTVQCLAAEQAATAPAAATTNAVVPMLSISSPDRLATWQQHLTLGAGDELSVSLYDEPDSGRSGLIIGPDGRLNYLEAQDVMASGLTIDELRARLEEILGKYHRSPRTVIIPTAYNSKRCFMLGNVVRRGPVRLSRPLTVLEAVAQAGGFVSRDGLILADLSRSFWIRKDAAGNFAPVNVDFEALFLRADLAQNQPLAPDDYLYFPPADLPEVYVLGDGALAPGIVPYAPDMSALKAITIRGGFNDKAFKRRVLIVRGSLSHPETFVVNAAEMLGAKATDFGLQPRDIVYVSRRPWAKAEELLEIAVFDFVRAVAITWAGANVGPFIKKPIF